MDNIDGDDRNDSFKYHSITSSSNHHSSSSNTSSGSLYRPLSRSRSNSYSSDDECSYRSHSRKSSMKIHDERSNSLNIFGLSYETTTQQLYEVFKKYGSISRINIVVDKTGQSRGFGFVDFKFREDAEEALKNCSSMEIDGRTILVEYSSSQRSPTPIPGISMDDLDITSTFRRDYEDRYNKDRYIYGKRSSSTYKNRPFKGRSHSRSWRS